MDTSKANTAKKITVIIPAFNEENAIAEVVKKIGKLDISAEIIVVDDCSTDKTGDSAREAGAKVIRHPYNKGNGASIKTGIRNAEGEVIVMMDADGQHRPEDIPLLIKDIGDYDMVVGARFSKSNGSYHRNFANGIFNAFASYLCSMIIQDLTSGFRAIKREIAKRYLYLLPNKFSYPTTITMALIRAGHSVKYVPVEMKKRVGKSKVRIFRDAIRFFIIMFRIISLFKPIKVFLPVSLVLFSTGLGYYIYTFIRYHRFTNMSLLLFLSSINIFLLGLIAEQISQLRYDRSED